MNAVSNSENFSGLRLLLRPLEALSDKVEEPTSLKYFSSLKSLPQKLLHKCLYYVDVPLLSRYGTAVIQIFKDRNAR